MKKHQRNGLTTSIILAIAAIVLAISNMGCVTIKPVCRHIVLSQYAAAIDAGYEARIVTFKNTGGGG